MKKSILYFLLSFSIFSYAQKQKKDTLFIRYDTSLLKKYQHPEDKYYYYLIKGTGHKEDIVSLKEEKVYKKLSPDKILCLKDVLKSSNSYYEKDKLHDWKLAKYLGKHIVFLVENEKYIEVQVVYEIE